jgi:hypothetical protein
MQKTPDSQSGIFNPRALFGFSLCLIGIFLAMLSFAATPPNPANFLSTFGSNANRLPPGVPLPPGAQFSPNGQGNPLSRSQAARFPGVAGMPAGLDAPPGWKPGTASGANSLGNAVFANQQPAPLSMQRPAASGSIPLATAAASGWSIVNSPNALVPKDAFYSVTCASPSNCWAVGYHIEHWDVTSWTIVPSPPNGGILDGVACASASLCWAVSYFQSGSLYQTIIEQWNGTSWSIISSPNPGTQYNFLYVGIPTRPNRAPAS